MFMLWNTFSAVDLVVVDVIALIVRSDVGAGNGQIRFYEQGKNNTVALLSQDI